MEAGSPFGGFHGRPLITASPFSTTAVVALAVFWWLRLRLGMTAGVTIMAMTTTMPAAPAMAIETVLAVREKLSALATAYHAALSRIQ